MAGRSRRAANMKTRVSIMRLHKDLSDLEACRGSARPGPRGIFLRVIIGGNDAIKCQIYDSGPEKRRRSFHPHRAALLRGVGGPRWTISGQA